MVALQNGRALQTRITPLRMKFCALVLAEEHGNVSTGSQGMIKALGILAACQHACTQDLWIAQESPYSQDKSYPAATKGKNKCVYIHGIRNSPQGRWKTYHTTVISGSRCQGFFKRRAKKTEKVSLFKVMPVPERIAIIWFALLVSDNLFSFPVRLSNIFVCYFEIGTPPQRPRSGTRKDPN